jgi:hypothetical protein
MKTIKKVDVTPVFVDVIPDEMFEQSLYISEKYGTIVHKCLCGCGEKVVTPIDNIIDGKDLGWKLIKNDKYRVSLTPSIGNFQLPCKSHYIITKNIANFV